MAKKPPTFDVNTYPYLDCREQHVWEPYDGVIDKQAKLAYRIQKCAHCPMRRHTLISMRAHDYGDVVSRSYRPPKDYRIPGGLDHRDRGRIRMANFLREISGQGESSH